MSNITMEEIKAVAEGYGLFVKSVSLFEGNTRASITFSNGDDDFKFDKGNSGAWLSKEFSRDKQWGYFDGCSTGGLNVNILYWHLLESEKPYGSFNTVEEMLGIIASEYGLNIPDSQIDLKRDLALGVFVDDFRIEDIDGKLAVKFIVESFDVDGKRSVYQGTEWIDLNDGLLSNKDCSDLYSTICGDKLTEEELAEVYNFVRIYLREESLDEDFLESYRDAAEIDDEALSAAD